MTNLFKTLFKESHLLVVIPGIFVVLMIIGLLIYGISDPIRSSVTKQDTLIEMQIAAKDAFYEDYQDGTYDEYNPFFVENPYEIAPLTGLLLFETEDSQQFKIVIRGKTEEANIEFISTLTTQHQIPVYGLYPDYANRIEVYSYNATTNSVGELVSAVTAITRKLPDEVGEVEELTTTYEYFQDDWMFLTPSTNNLPVAIDAFGDVRWYSTVPFSFSFKQLGNGHYMVGTNRLMSSPYYTTGLYELDLLGKVYFEYQLPGGFHHDFVELDNGNIIVLTNDFEGTVEDVVVEIERSTGNIIKRWDLEDYVDPLDGMAQMWTVSDWFHNNSIDYDPITNDILLSGRHQDIVIAIDYTTNELEYIIGDPNQWDTEFVTDYFLSPIGDDFEWSYAQHSAVYLPNGNIFMFDNGNNRSKDSSTYLTANNNYSRGVIYTVDQVNRTIEQVYSYGTTRGNSFYSPYISNVEYYGDNHYLIHSGGIARTLEGALNIPAPLYTGDLDVTTSSITIELLQDEVVYELVMADHYYRAVRITPYDAQTRVNLAPGARLGSMMETMRSDVDVESEFTLFHNIPRSYDISIVKEVDRLVIEGTFDQQDLIYLVLENDSSKIVYHIPTSTTAYTAMCTAIFQGDDRRITFYVNEENMEGTYNLYLIINNHQYDSYRRVTFK